ncbi:MAG: substrate-binding domain-containing protein [Thermomicrobiales bacterium]|nr:substrate-binding domain-containing protein [Thermomicrobiales bacterium]
MTDPTTRAAARYAASRRQVMRWAAAGAALGVGAGLTAGMPARAAAQEGSGEYVEVLALITLPYFIDHKAGLDAAGQVFNVPTRFVGPPDLDLNAMITTLEQVIAQKPAGLMVVGFDAVLKPSIDKAVEAGIPTVTLDGDVAGSKRQIFIGTGNVAAGQKGAQTLIEAIGGEGKVVIVTRVGQGNLEERIIGYKQAIEATDGKVELVEVLNDDSDPNKAASVVSAALGKYPDLKGIACVEAAGGVGAATAVKEGNRVGEVVIVSMDRDDGTLNFIKEGVIHASVAQKTALMPFTAVQILHTYNSFKLPITQDDAKAGVTPLPNSVDTGSEIITKDSVDLWFHKA